MEIKSKAGKQMLIAKILNWQRLQDFSMKLFPITKLIIFNSAAHVYKHYSKGQNK